MDSKQTKQFYAPALCLIYVLALLQFIATLKCNKMVYFFLFAYSLLICNIENIVQIKGANVRTTSVLGTATIKNCYVRS